MRPERHTATRWWHVQHRAEQYSGYLINHLNQEAQIGGTEARWRGPCPGTQNLGAARRSLFSLCWLCSLFPCCSVSRESHVTAMISLTTNPCYLISAEPLVPLRKPHSSGHIFQLFPLFLSLQPTPAPCPYLLLCLEDWSCWLPSPPVKSLLFSPAFPFLLPAPPEAWTPDLLRCPLCPCPRIFPLFVHLFLLRQPQASCLSV